MELDPADRLLLSGLGTMAVGAIGVAGATAAAPVVAFAAAGTLAVGITGFQLGIVAEFMPRKDQIAIRDAYAKTKEIVEAIHDPEAALAGEIMEHFHAKTSENLEQFDRVRDDLRHPPTTEPKTWKEQAGEAVGRIAPSVKTFADEILKDPEPVPIHGELTNGAGDVPADNKGNGSEGDLGPRSCEPGAGTHSSDRFGRDMFGGDGAGRNNDHPSCSDSNHDNDDDSEGHGGGRP